MLSRGKKPNGKGPVRETEVVRCAGRLRVNGFKGVNGLKALLSREESFIMSAPGQKGRLFAAEV